MESLKVKLFSKTAKLPTRLNAADVGYDLYYDGPVRTILTGVPNVLELNVGVDIPRGVVGLMLTRSGLSSKFGCAVLANVVDPEYTGAIRAVLTTEQAFIVKPGDRVAQLVLVPALTPQVVEVTEFAETERGDKGLGSSGV